MSFTALIQKDVEQNAKPLLLISATGLFLACLMVYNSDPAQGSAGGEGFLAGSLVFGMPIMFSMWLIGQEKAKGTFAILKSLPISGAEINLAKWTLASMYTLLATIVVDFVLPMLLHHSTAHIGFEQVTHCVWIVALSMMVSGFYFSLFTVFDQKVATQAAWISMGLFVFSIGHIVQMPQTRLFFHQHAKLFTGPIMRSLWLVAIFVGFIFILFAGKYFDQTDMSELREY